MKKYMIAFAVAAIAIACSAPETNQEGKEKLGKSYGPVKVDVSKAITVKEMLNDFEGKEGEVEYTFEADISEVCSKAGCWINVDKGNGDMFMVRFKDHFTIPPKTDVGTGAYLHGVAFMDTISVADLQHFAEDAGKSQEEIDMITEAEFELNFTADGITLKK
ncbi:DUF4920 domain-containing protein [Crocinitomicaceae bacterium]|nr:DUF4920 domain-containing protein [Crocinitomicaceae bacterium]MDC0257611.1 DUF4920 domain-containing protein [Crocinitomicaceae bacterium]